MTVARFTHNDGRNFCCGRNAPASVPDVPKLERFIGATLLPPPAVREDWAGPALNKAGLENILANDQLGCCVESACGHIIDVWHANAGTGQSVTADQAIAFYSASSGYVPGNPATDQGSDEVTVLNYWQAHGYASATQAKPVKRRHRRRPAASLASQSTPIAGYVAVDPTNVVALKTALWLFGNLLFGGALLTDWVAGMNSLQNGFTWNTGSAPDPKAGHAFMGYGYNDNGVFIDSWALFGTITWSAIAQFAAASAGGNSFSVLSADWLSAATQESPSGFAFPQLQADLAMI